ncbi:hypothetical protein K444DRAFT_619229 [Hyaloscypha bicolor E]|uniref:Uncharacterized protein n=1 Tax=Hyaloscypha bicolor E TaxID=1095630 RepID=A0A2J6SR50_9HELO|nr:hypothetical protein K444DRAFT_619229 [Hyaloscypha bicolor E]
MGGEAGQTSSQGRKKGKNESNATLKLTKITAKVPFSAKTLFISRGKKAKTYNSRYSLVVTHPTTNLPI